MKPVFPIIVTDLDGSLLDHHTYDFAPARPLIEQLKQHAIPVIPCTSKTRVEVEHLRAEVGLVDPYVVENGAAIVMPGFKTVPTANHESANRNDDVVIELSSPRAHWTALINSLKSDFKDQFQSFADAGDDGVMTMTGLDLASAKRANTRDYSEPVAWLGDDDTKQRFVARLYAMHARVLQGGRFLAVGGDCDKGRALKRLQSAYQSRHSDRRVISLAIGDSGNDVAMLEAADEALVIRSPVHEPPALQRRDGVTISQQTGPQGWNEGVRAWLHRIGVQIELGSTRQTGEQFNEHSAEPDSVEQDP